MRNSKQNCENCQVHTKTFWKLNQILDVYLELWKLSSSHEDFLKIESNFRYHCNYTVIIIRKTITWISKPINIISKWTSQNKICNVQE